MKFDSAATIFRKVLVRGLWLLLVVGVLAGVIGYLVSGMAGLFSGLIGAAMTLLFVSLTALSVMIGAKLPLGGFFGVVMGGWLVKMVLFMVSVRLLQDVSGLDHKVLGFTLIASILGSLGIDAYTVTKSRQPIVEN